MAHLPQQPVTVTRSEDGRVVTVEFAERTAPPSAARMGPRLALEQARIETFDVRYIPGARTIVTEFGRGMKLPSTDTLLEVLGEPFHRRLVEV